MKRLALVLAAAAVVLGAGCTRGDPPGGQAVLEVEEGSRVLAAEQDEGLHLVDGRRTLGIGGQVKVLAGSASIALDDGSRLEVRKGSEVALGSPLRLIAGDLLVESDRRSLTVAAAGSELVVTGAGRLLRDLAVSAASYRGSVTIRSAGRSLPVPALRQAAVPTLGELPAQPEPLEYDPNDPESGVWDRRFLGSAIELGDELEAKSRGFTVSLRPKEGRTPGFYRLLLPELETEPTFGPELLSDARPPGDTLIGATIAVTGKLGSFTSRWDNVFSFRDQGAAWGLVALDQHVDDAGALISRVDAAIGRQSFAFAPPAREAAAQPARPTTRATSAAPAPSPERTATPPSPPEPPPSPAPTTSPPSGPLPTTPVTPPPLPPPTAPVGDALLAPLVDTVNDTIGGLLPIK